MRKLQLKKGFKKAKSNLTNKKIDKKIMLNMILSSAVPLILITIVSLTINYLSIISTLKKTLSKSAELASMEITSNLDNYKAAMTDLANNQIFDEDNFNAEQLDIQFNNTIKNYDFKNIGYADINENTLYGTDISEITDTACFDFCTSTNITTISDLMINAKTNEPQFVIMAPIIRNSQIKGVVYGFKDADFLSKITKKIKLSDNSSSYILNSNGDIIAHDDISLVKNKKNFINDSNTDSSYKDLAEIQKKMIAGESGFGTYTYDFLEKTIAYTPIDKTNNWSIGLAGETDEFLSGMKKEILIIIVLAIILLLLNIKYSKILSYNISNPINSCINRLELLSKGDLESDIPEITTDDETKILADATKKTVESLRMYILDIKQVLGSIAAGNLAVETSMNYDGDFIEIQKSLSEIIQKLNETFHEIKEAGFQVHEGSSQMSETSQDLATGATEQADSINHLTESMNKITEEISNTSIHAQNTNSIVNSLTKNIERGNKQMNEMLTAMDEIEENSQNIRSIIETINNIAEETNLLSLNAAIEAARAGEAGKGFAVVAEQVKKLAEQSSKAVKNTADLIETSIKSVAKGKQITDETSKMLNEIVKHTKEAADLVNNITGAAQNQALSIKQINDRIEQISDIVQSNSAVAEESAAATEELTAQAETLDNMIKKFTLK
ncbi:methyl-accepting chemotaxis protein [uncultured Clostridium sp.]|uniref:methyl-accepting chemotaxis protein n=1 Tax=uncultured Clostridium sp. TaxID=59620 RepID=UPI0025DFFD19|nr:methyl-accepting chemotaxis protein [uncultured Clostridium sp.]